MTTAAEQAASAARHAFAHLTEQAMIALRQGGADAEGDGDRWPIMRNGTLHRDGERFPVRTLDLSSRTVKVETPSAFPEDMLGTTVELEVDILGRFPIRLLTTTMSGYEAVLVDPRPSLTARIAAEIARLRTLYWPRVERVQAIAREVEGIMAEALRTGALSPGQLYDANYVRQGLSEPAEYRNAAVDVLEALLRPLLEREVGIAPSPEFCFVQDRNGFNPVHNVRYSQPRRTNDREWNLRNSRMRTLVDHRVGMTASRNLRPFLVQSRTNDLGDGSGLLMEFNAPLFADGRHWGTVRMAYDLRREG